MYSSPSFDSGSSNSESINFDTGRPPEPGWRHRLKMIDRVAMEVQDDKAWAIFEKEVSVPGPTNTICLRIHRLVFN